MPSQHTAHDVTVTWFSVREIPPGREELDDQPIATELLTRRRTWTTARDLIEASTDTEIWRQPTPWEWEQWELDDPKPAQICDAEVAWLVATTGEPGVGVPTKMAVRLQEQVVR